LRGGASVAIDSYAAGTGMIAASAVAAVVEFISIR
jgi:ribosomal protein S5